MLFGEHIRIHYDAYAMQAVVYVFECDRETKDTKILSKDGFVDLPVGQIASPIFSLNDEALQQLMDDLHIMGVRPSPRFNQDHPVKAIDAHLQDMRALVAHAYECAL